jgi:outer membrane protein OmpA-like peptidoglycan-associated protein
MRRLVGGLVSIAFVLLGACGGGGDDAAVDDVEETTTTVAAEDDTTTTEGPRQPEELPPGATPGQDDYGGDGELDPTCGTQDFGGGLVLRIPCEIAAPSGPPDGVTLTEGSLYRLNGSIDINLDGISGSLLLARDDAGTKVAIVTANSDALFEVGSDQIASTDTVDNVIKLINERFPKSRIQVRGHTDSTGSAGSNQALSERRAANVRSYLEGHGVDAAEIASIGLGSSQPFAVEDNDDARAFNRRVEIVLRVPE